MPSAKVADNKDFPTLSGSLCQRHSGCWDCSAPGRSRWLHHPWEVWLVAADTDGSSQSPIVQVEEEGLTNRE
jgi:hypothetical protein